MSPSDEQCHHLRRVLRAKVGDEVEVVDSKGAVWRGRIHSLTPVTIAVIDQDARQAAANPHVQLEVWVPLLKAGRTDPLVRQLVEIGATTIVPYRSERTVVRPDARRARQKQARWQTIATEATRQCGRTDRPEVSELRGLPESGPGLFLWEGEGPALRAVIADAVAARPVRLLTGPEGGLTRSEVRGIEACGWTRASLGARILRAETAVIVLATLAVDALGSEGF